MNMQGCAETEMGDVDEMELDDCEQIDLDGIYWLLYGSNFCDRQFSCQSCKNYVHCWVGSKD